MMEKVSSIRSKESIICALFALMKNDQYELLTISEIAANANLDRRPIYRHFKTKEDVISYYIKTSAKEYETLLNKNTIFDNRAITEAIFTVCSKQKKELLLLFKHNLSYLLLKEMSKLFEKYQAKFAAKEELEHPYRSYMLTYHIGGFWNIMNEWLSRGGKELPAEMANIITQMMEIKQI